jgi:molecular chaperone DnaK
VPQIEVSFDIDANGIVHVAAKDLGTGKEQSIRITAPKKLSKEEIEKMVKDAEKYAADDVKKKEQVEVINQADNLVYASEKALKDYGDKVNQDERAAIEASVNDLKSAIKDKNTERVKKGMEDLTKASHKLAEEIYKQSAAKQQQGSAASPKADAPQQEQAQESTGQDKKEDIIDAEFKDEDEGKK